jgi:hypothetical protein
MLFVALKENKVMASGRRLDNLLRLAASAAGLLLALMLLAAPACAQALNANSPAVTVRLAFIHHSVGQNWLTDDHGNLLRELNANNYYVTDTNYGWGPVFQEEADSGTIGDHTDTGNWYNWFLGDQRDLYLEALYTNNQLTPDIGVNTIAYPGGENTVIVFKSCFPNGQDLHGNADDAPRISTPDNPNPLWGTSDHYYYTVSNIKGLYRDLLAYCATRPDRLFILIATPPSFKGDYGADARSVRNARAINTWLVNHWLDGYPLNNVAVFDFFNVLTSDGGNAYHHDLNAAAGNHHRFRGGRVQHSIQKLSNFSAYPSGHDSHPTAAGNQKATAEFLPLLNIAYHAWQGDGGVPTLMGRGPRAVRKLRRGFH